MGMELLPYRGHADPLEVQVVVADADTCPEAVL
jgi:hypothetical protein